MIITLSRIQYPFKQCYSLHIYIPWEIKLRCSSARRNNLYYTEQPEVINHVITHRLIYLADSWITTILVSLRDTYSSLFTSRIICVHSVSEGIHWRGWERTRAQTRALAVTVRLAGFGPSQLVLLHYWPTIYPPVLSLCTFLYRCSSLNSWVIAR